MVVAPGWLAGWALLAAIGMALAYILVVVTDR
jgi:hypothetical protein